MKNLKIKYKTNKNKKHTYNKNNTTKKKQSRFDTLCTLRVTTLATLGNTHTHTYIYTYIHDESQFS